MPKHITPVRIITKSADIEKLTNDNNSTLLFLDIKDPYDPSKPNDYDEYLEEKKKNDLKYDTETYDDEEEEEEIYIKPVAPVNPQSTPSFNPIVEKWMKNMGWKGKGHGLGKQEQGITAPLIAQKSGSGSQGIIINTSVTNNTNNNNNNPVPKFIGNKSRIIMLRNMVAAGEVDPSLEDETAEECSKYGPILSCLVYEDPDPNILPEDSIRVYVEFDSKEDANKAILDLDGRFFDLRVVRATFFDENRFMEMDFKLGEND